MIPLLLPHSGGHRAPRRPPFFRRMRLRRRPPVPAELSAGAVPALPDGAEPVLGDRTVAEVRAEYSGLPRRVPGAALAAEPLPTPEQMRDAYFGRPVYQQAPVAEVLKGEQEGCEVA